MHAWTPVREGQGEVERREKGCEVSDRQEGVSATTAWRHLPPDAQGGTL